MHAADHNEGVQSYVMMTNVTNIKIYLHLIIDIQCRLHNPDHLGSCLIVLEASAPLVNANSLVDTKNFPG